MKKLIKSSQKNKFENINVIDYNCRTMSDLRNVHIPFNGKYEPVMYFSNNEPNRNGTFQLEVSGKMIDFQIHQRHNVLEICGYDRDKESVTESIHNYFLEFFGSSTKFNWIVMDIKEGLNHSFPNLRNVSLCVDLTCKKKLVEIEKLETFFSSSPVFNYIGLELKPSPQPCSPQSKFYQAESILVKHTSPNILRHFEGKQAYIQCDKWETSEDLIKLLNMWKSGKALQMLERLTVDILHGKVLKNEIFNKIGAKYIDATKQPPVHTLPQAYIEGYFFGPPNTIPITSHTYVVRQSDNRVASIHIAYNKMITFGVWDKTEEEFLKLVD
ncbi:hypothetical protein B9Z55_024990 [Caenorhabditis nigoni]|nr:hypothetical protein B9Z55_024990 [Caenorhabditis nigoni]